MFDNSGGNRIKGNYHFFECLEEGWISAYAEKPAFFIFMRIIA